MKNFLIVFLLVLSVLLSSCGKKKEEVKIYKQSSQDSSPVTRTDTTGTNGAKDNELTSAGDESISTISTEEANSFINKKAVVKGYVADVVIREKVAYLNFDKKFPKNTFSAVIFSDKFSEVGDLSIYKNKIVEVKGTVSTYKDKPQIIVTSKNQIQIPK